MKTILKRLFTVTIMYAVGLIAALGIVSIMQKQGINTLKLSTFVIILYVSIMIMEGLFTYIEEKGKDDNG